MQRHGEEASREERASQVTLTASPTEEAHTARSGEAPRDLNLPDVGTRSHTDLTLT